MTDYTNKFNTFLNRLSFRNLTAGSPGLESGIEVDDSIQSSREKIANLRDEKINDPGSNFSRYNFIGSSLFDNENPEPISTTLAMGEEEDSLPPSYDNYISNRDNNQSVNGFKGDDLIDSVGNNNNINAGKGNDLIYNNGSNNRIRTGDGADQLISSGKNNVIRTGSGADQIELGSNSGGSKVSAGRGDDNIVINEQSKGSISIKGGSGDDTVTIRGDEADYELSTDSKTGNRKYVHKTNGSEINIEKDVENIDFEKL
jgi:Ca2+-binding RTX toxin-like protein